jgi:hypothetical protein
MEPIRMRMHPPLLAGLMAIATACGSSYTGEAAGVVPAKSPGDALACLIKAAEANGYKQIRADSGSGDASATMRKEETIEQARSGNPNEFYQGGELKLATSPGTAGSIKATVTPFFVIVTRTAAGPNSTLYPPKEQAIADAPVVLNACGKATASAAKK